MSKEKVRHMSIVLALTLGMSFSVVYGILYTIRPDQQPGFVLGTVMVFMAIGLLIGRSRKSFIITIAVFLISAGLLGAYLFYEGLLITACLKIKFFVLRNKELLGISFVTVGIVYLFTIKYLKVLWPPIIGSSLYILYIIRQEPLPSFSVELFVLMSICYYFYYYHLKMTTQILEANYGAKSKSALKSISLFIALVFGITCLGAHVTPLRFFFLHQLLDSKDYESRSYRYGEYYPYTGRLGGAITLGDQEVMEVVADKQTYLRAGTKSIYTGYSWTNEIVEPEVFLIGKTKFADTYEALLGMSLLSDVPINELFDEESYRITFKDIRTRSLFMPPKSTNLAVSRDSHSIYSEYEDTLVLGVPYGKGFIYVVHSYIPKEESKVFKEALRKSEIGLYTEAKARGIDPFEGYIDQFIERASAIQTRYTQLPKSVTQRVRDLAVSLTEPYDTTYDKVSAIEHFLATNYRYTLSPCAVGPNQDFVDQFLFETKEGYCTYFASAMAVLTRCLGIPSRYVEGYTMPEADNQDDTTYTITSKQAHAWVEVYFEGVGWVMFEPTASYQNDNWNPVTSTYQGVTGIEQRQVDMLEPVVGTRTQHTKYTAGLAIGALCFVAVSLILYGYRRSKIKHMQPREAICYFYKRIFKRFSKKMYQIELGETELTYAQRIDQGCKIETISFEEITHIYLKAQYSPLDMTKEEREIVEQFYKSLRKALRKRR